MSVNTSPGRERHSSIVSVVLLAVPGAGSLVGVSVSSAMAEGAGNGALLVARCGPQPTISKNTNKLRFIPPA